ncbi:MAG: type II toxin-antitoxin system RelE/ParE family toxin [Candidatus Bathyarchaeia archaeon]|jgi:mRNA interferase RelE/StbE
MPYAVKLHREVAKTPAGMPPKLRSSIIRALRTLQMDPFQHRSGTDIIRLKGTRGRQDLFRLRIGDYRAVYAVEGNVVYVTDMFHRGKGY